VAKKGAPSVEWRFYVKGVWDDSRRERAVGIQPDFVPDPPTQAGSLCYNALRSVERSLEMLSEGSSAHPRDGVV
jgi:hypothetical protein